MGIRKCSLESHVTLVWLRWRSTTVSIMPIRQPSYSVPLGLRDKVSKETEALQQAERSDSLWASSLVPVRKLDDKI